MDNKNLKLQITGTVNGWFEKTISDCIKSTSPKNYPVDGFLLSVLLVSRKYIIASLVLLKNGHKLPAMALMRVLIEFLTKLTWCLGIHEKNVQDRAGFVENNRRRWWNTTLDQRIKELKKWQNVSDQNLKQEVDTMLKQLQLKETQNKLQNVGKMPENFKKLVEQLPEKYLKDAYPKLYIKYNHAIHLDIGTLRQLVPEQEKNRIITYYEDSQENAKELTRNVVYCALMVNDWIRIYYGLDTKRMKEKGDNIIKRLSEKEEQEKNI